MKPTFPTLADSSALKFQRAFAIVRATLLLPSWHEIQISLPSKKKKKNNSVRHRLRHQFGMTTPRHSDSQFPFLI